MNPNLFRMLFLEPLQLLLCLLVVEACILKLRLKFAVLRLQQIYLRFRLRQAVDGQRKTLAHNARERDFVEGVSGKIDQAHAPKASGEARLLQPNFEALKASIGLTVRNGVISWTKPPEGERK